MGHSWYHSTCALQVKVKRRGDDEKFLAQVLAIGTECDIALLTIDDQRFWDGVTPLEFGPLPRLQVRQPCQKHQYRSITAHIAPSYCLLVCNHLWVIPAAAY